MMYFSFFLFRAMNSALTVAFSGQKVGNGYSVEYIITCTVNHANSDYEK